MSPKRSSPGLKPFNRAFMVSFSLPSLRMFKLNEPPGSMKDSTARSFATATVNAGGLNDAWETQEANIADCTSPFFAVTAHKEPTMRPTAASVCDIPENVSDCTRLDSAFWPVLISSERVALSLFQILRTFAKFLPLV